MLKTYIKIAVRNLWNNKGYTAINSIGLGIGLAVFVLVLLYINHERSYDKWDDQLDRVYRAGIEEEGEKSLQIQYPLGTYLSEDCPEVEKVTRVRVVGEVLVSNNKIELFTRKVISADSNFFRVFPYKFIYGDAITALQNPQTVVITRDLSEALYGDDDPVGKLLKFDNKKELAITGVVEKIGPSHLDFDVCVSYHDTYFASNWYMKNHDTYALLNAGYSIVQLMEKVSDTYSRNSTTQGRNEASVFFEPISKIHLQPEADGRVSNADSVYDFQAGNDRPLFIFSLIGISVLLLSCINYTNMAVARAGRRAKESGLRKVLGSSRQQLVLQFLTEALIQSLISLSLAILFTVLLIGILNTAFSLDLSLWSDVNNKYNIRLLGQVLLIVLLVTLISGAYPAYLLSGFAPAKVLKGDIWKNTKGIWLRNSLVIIQYSVATCFIVSILIVSLQLKFMRTNDPGFNASQVLRIQARNLILLPGQPGDQSEYLKQSLSRIPGVNSVSMSGSYPGKPIVNMQEATFEANPDTLLMNFNFVNFDYFDVLGMHISKGRNFSSAFASDSVNNAVINETAAQKMGWKDPIGKKIDIVGRKYNIIGVAKNSLFSGYGTIIAPEIYAIGVDTRNFSGHDNVLIKVDPNSAPAVLTAVTNLWKAVQPDYPIRYSWLDEDFARLMQKHERFGKLTGFLTLAALTIAMMGLFALSAFTAEQRIKEIGIRKVLGATVAEILKMLSGDFLKLVFAAIIIAIPVSRWAMNMWLNDFAYRIEISTWMFVFAGLLAVFIALATVSIHVIKAALMNPVKSLRSE